MYIDNNRVKQNHQHLYQQSSILSWADSDRDLPAVWELTEYIVSRCLVFEDIVIKSSEW